MQAKTLRTDIHRPSAIIPEDYEFVAFEYMKIEGFGDCEAVLRNRELIKIHMEGTGGFYSMHEHGGNCHICGAHAVYTVLFYHAKTNTYIRTGQDCAQKLEMGYGDFNAFRKAIGNAREAQAGKRKAHAILEDAGLSAVWAICSAEFPQHSEECKASGRDANGDDNGAFNECTCDQLVRARAWDRFEERTIRDIVQKLVKYGSVSDKQIALLRKLLTIDIPARAEREAAEAALAEAAAPCPSGRITISGTVLGMKTEESAFGYSRYSGPQLVTKILVRAEEGFKVWGTRFANVEKGQHVKFVATVEPSDKDPKFGFFKRPTLAKATLTKEQKKAVRILKDARKSIEDLCNEDYATWNRANETFNGLISSFEYPDLGSAITPTFSA